MFNYVLDTHGLKLDQDGQPRTTYSLRHYALQTRLNKSGRKVNIYNKGREGKSRDMRHLLRDYVLILANTGIRHGTEADNLRWKHITLFEEKGGVVLEMSVRGKTGRRDIICRSGTVNYLKRIQGWCVICNARCFGLT